jgi:DNA-binding NtrC family response regulator/tetratricopeptide (TPR) repeat protein
MIPLDELLGVSRAIAVVREQAQQLLAREQRARRLPPILLQGETGTGKGLLARLLHRGGPRGDGPFIDVSCAAIPDALFEAELFGFERGAFTDARHAKPGLLHAAHRGTIFLDEVALLPETFQAKLLKAIEERAVRRLGSTRAETVDVQIIAASNEDLAAAARTRRFRNDLYHRLAVVTLTLPPLRERPEDVLFLAEHFLSRACADYGLRPPKRFAPDARSALQEYPWPGNVRELSNVIESAVLLADKPTITAAMLRLPPKSPTDLAWSDPEEDLGSFDDRVGNVEREQLLGALHDTNWNISLAAIRLGISRNRLRYRIEKHALRAGQFLLRRGQRHARSAEPAAPNSAVDPPTTARAAGLRWERRYLALLRAELVPAATAGPPPDPARALTVIADKIRSFGGDIQELATMTIVGVFGLEPVDNAPNSAALAALAIQKAAERARRIDSLVPAVKIVVHAAQLMVGQVNGLAQIDLEDKRATETTLAALSDVGQPNSILISAAAAPFLERRFELARDSPIEGGAGPLYHLTRPERTGFGLGGRALARFVGRQRELAIVDDQLAQAERDRGQIVAVVGEPGVGKSRFVYELTRADRVRGWRILSCRAVSYGVTTPSLPVVELLKGYFQIDDAETPSQIREKISQKILQQGSRLEPHLPALLALLGVSSEDPLWRALEPPQRRQRTIDAVKHVLLQESLAQPLLVIFEDLHWIDTETQGLLDALAESLPAARVLLLVTYRPEYQHRWGAKTYYTQLRIDPLTGESAQALLQLLVGEDASLLPLKWLLIERTEGNPLFLEESVQALAETSTLQGSRGAYRLNAPAASLEVPATVQAILAARIDRLSPEDKRLLQAAAVIGKDVPYPLLQAIAELPEEQLRQGLADLQGGEFIYEATLFPDLAYTFKHALTHEVAYGSVLQEQRRSLHSRIMEAIEQLYAERLAEQLERLGYHAFRAEAWQRAVAYLRQSGEKAYSRSANREAAAWFEQALDALSHCPKGPAFIEQGIDLRFDLRSALHPLGEFERILDALQEAQRLAELVGDRQRLARVLGYLALTLAFTGAPDRALAAGHRALEIAEGLGERGLAVATNCVLGMIYQNLGQYRRSMGFNNGTIEALQGELIRERSGMPVFPAVYSRHVALLALAPLGEFDEATALAEEGFQIAEAVGHPLSQLYMYMAGGFLHAYRGHFSEAIRLLEHGRMLCEVTDARLIFGWVASYLGSAYAGSGRISDGITLLEQGVDTLTTLNVMLRRSLVTSWLGEAYVSAERTDDAAECAGKALDLARAQNERGHEAEALRLLGDIALCRGGREIEDSADSYRRAMAIAKDLGMHPLLARCHLGLGTILLRTDQTVNAREHLTTALEMFRAMEMQYWIEKAAAEMADLRS